MKNEWKPLDNAAKIFPSAISKTDTHVFRFSCELFETIDPEPLSQAVEEALVSFPLYRDTIRTGVFWYYLEQSDLKPKVREEYKPPCSNIYDRDKKTLLFEVTYYKNRINLEVFHALTDGTGAMHFLCTIVTKYLARVHHMEEPILDYDASFAQKQDDSFRKYYSPKEEGQKPERQKKTCQLRGRKHPDNQLKVVCGRMPVDQVIRTAHQYNATVTALLAACLISSIGEDLNRLDLRRQIGLVIPVNLRNFFQSESARNFFSLVFVNYDFLRESQDFEAIVGRVNRDLKERLTQENMEKRLNSLLALEKNMFTRVVPLYIKDIFLRIGYRQSERQSTASLSNIGIARMPKSMEDYVRAFDVACATSKMQACVCSYRNMLSITFTSVFVSTEIQRRFFRRLAELGIRSQVSVNRIGQEEEL